MHKRIYLAILFLCFSAFTFSRSFDIGDDVATAIKEGDWEQIASYFNKVVDLTILNQEGVYSKAQAGQILKSFFQKNKPGFFTVLHKGSSKQGMLYTIGNLSTSQGNFRTSFFVEQVGGKYFIQELRFE